MIIGLLWLAGGLAVLALALKLAFPLPDRNGIAKDGAAPDRPSALARSVSAATASHPGLAGVRLIPVGVDAFAARIAMVRAAQNTIDAQYYIWEDDLSDHLLLQALIEAADRGVRVRLLIDDNPTAGLDPMWRAIDSHPGISVRLFNPLTIRAVRPLNYLFDFPRLNRRMHNKSLTVDGAVTLVGGRNVGDAYFGVKAENLFIDLDAVVIGAAVPDVSHLFETYWQSPSAYPAGMILGTGGPADLQQFRARRHGDADLERAFAEAAGNAIAAMDFGNAAGPVVWAPVRLVGDDPAKALGKADRTGLLASQIAPLIAGAHQRFDLVSGYFVPGTYGAGLLTGLARRGIPVRVVTNSIQVTDVPLVNAGYDPYRKPLLAAGVALFEAKPQPREDGSSAETNLGKTSFSGGGESVHAKTFAIDGKYLFVGSFNFDPRSALLNCEMGLVIESPDLAGAFSQALDQRLPLSAYRLKLDQGDLVWEDGARRFAEEPGTTAFQRGMLAVLSRLPVEWLL